MVEALRVEGYEDEARELGGLDVEGFVTTAPGLAAWLPSEIAGLVLMAADTTALAEGRRLEAREPQLRSHIEASPMVAPHTAHSLRTWPSLSPTRRRASIRRDARPGSLRSARGSSSAWSSDSASPSPNRSAAFSA